MNKQTRRTGNKNEEKVCWFFKQNGYEVWMPSWGGRGHGRFRSSDILGVFDVMAYTPREMILIQVKTAKGFSAQVQQEIQELQLPPGIEKDYWVFKPNGVIHARRYGGGGYHQYLIDLEKMTYELQD